jgi:predicted dienelactone hydrolase
MDRPCLVALALWVLVVSACGNTAEKPTDAGSPEHNVQPPDQGTIDLPSPTPDQSLPSQLYDVEQEDLTWTDKSRAREVPVRIFAPAKRYSGTLFPLVVFSHGGGESRASYSYLGNHWAKHGYIVVFATHKGFDSGSLGGDDPNGFFDSDIQKRPDDLSFVLDRILSSNPTSSLLRGRVDSDKIAAAGQCAGASTALMLAGLAVDLDKAPNSQFVDSRVDVVIALSPQVGAGAVNRFAPPAWSEVTKPTLIIAGTEDFGWLAPVKEDPSIRLHPYDRMVVSQRYLVDIAGAEHHAFTDTKPYYPVKGKRDPRHHGWIQQATTAFLNAQLKQDASEQKWLERKELQRITNGECHQENGDDPPIGRMPTYKATSGALTVKAVDLLLADDGAHGRDIPLRVTFPKTNAGRFPLVLFSHAAGGDREDYVALIEYWASHGYVCIQPSHVSGSAGTTYQQRPKDMTFVLDNLSTIEASVAGLAGRIDTTRIGAAGHYIGAGTANLLLGTEMNVGGQNPLSFEDKRVLVSLAMSPTGVGQGLTPQSWQSVDRPMLVLTGSKDVSKRTGNPAEWRKDPYLYAKVGDKYLVWIEGLTSEYGGLPQGKGNSDIASYIKMVSLAYLDAYLKEDIYAGIYLRSTKLQTYASGAVSIERK